MMGTYLALPYLTIREVCSLEIEVPPPVSYSQGLLGGPPGTR